MQIVKPCQTCGAEHFKTVCGFCGKEADPIKLETLLLVAGAILLAGFIIGSLITFSATVK